MTEKEKNSFLWSNRILISGFILAAGLTYLLFPTYFDQTIWPISFNGPSWWTLDPSWVISLNKVQRESYNWGNEVIFTYGPLSYLSTRLMYGLNKYHLLLFDLFMAINFFCIFFISFKRSRNLVVTVALMICVCIMLPNSFGSGNAIILSAFLLFWVRESFDNPHPAVFLMQVTILTLLFFLKFNTGLISFIYFFAALAYSFIYHKHKRWFLLAYTGLLVALVAIGCYQLNVSLSSYIKGGLEAVSGYTQIMYLTEPYDNEKRFALAAIVIAAILIIRKLIMERQTLLKNALTAALFIMSMYILYKQAFTRIDQQHVTEFFVFVLVFVLVFPEFHIRESQSHNNAFVTVIIFIALFCGKKRDEHFFRFGQRIWKTDYYQRLLAYDNNTAMNLHPNENQVPERISKRIGSDPVDVYPWNSHLLFQNKLNYKPRPIFQSYMAYTAYLEEKNFDYFNQPSAPKFMLYDLESIDNRYPLFDEPKLNLLLMKNYAVADTFRAGPRLTAVLEKKKETRKVQMSLAREYKQSLAAPLRVRDGYFYEVSVAYSISGKITALLDQVPVLWLTIHKKSGYRMYRTSPKLLQAGLFSDRFMNSTEDFISAIDKGAATLEKVSEYRFQPLDAKQFNPEVHIKEYKIQE